MTEALLANGLPGRSTEELVPLVGPPIARAFARLAGAPDDSPLVAACVAAYRERYAVVSVRDAASFDGMPEAVAQLAATTRSQWPPPSRWRSPNRCSTRWRCASISPSWPAPTWPPSRVQGARRWPARWPSWVTRRGR